MTGQIVAIPVRPNVPVMKDDVLFQIDPAPLQYMVNPLMKAARMRFSGSSSILPFAQSGAL